MQYHSVACIHWHRHPLTQYSDFWAYQDSCIEGLDLHFPRDLALTNAAKDILFAFSKLSLPLRCHIAQDPSGGLSVKSPTDVMVPALTGWRQSGAVVWLNPYGKERYKRRVTKEP